ncbi:LOW QUALITY PROTEIN: DNA/RNA helicase, superfamily I [Saccharomonospora xinjiangensis XJ-54]|uniref:DNA/RNA helicase, superfamily I n=1 Tax=Saccharomonospora xinjiangensis XJ-54 TaxID=882086 RepID=I0UWX2_9PSEU|nr:LOW QUALITY PROTEIN: DNA/RNA helicase, superfamily I [Saccharomonospora xinjiangensis XJ-54]
MRQAAHDPVDPEIHVERDYMDFCRAELARMREEVSTALATGAGEGEAVVDKYFNHALRQFRTRMVEELAELDAPLFFGRLDYAPGEIYGSRDGRVHERRSRTRAPDSDRAYLGRRGVRDEEGEPMVIDWRAELARAFYEASHENTMGVRIRRRYGFDGDGVLTAYEDEPLSSQATSRTGGGLLASEIERPRTGPMRDIVATIQPEQMRLVRAPLEHTLCVQGAPGTGKTAVGLHRLAYLLYSKRERLRKEGGVAVIGPNRSFLSYIRDVLPALGEVKVAQITIDELTGSGVAAERVDDPPTARVKGDARMAEVIRRHLWSRIRPPQETVEVQHQHRTWRLSPEEIAEELDAVLTRGPDYGAGRELLAQRLAHLVLRRMERAGNSTTTLHQLCRHRGVARAVRQMWPAVDAARLVFDLLTDRTHLAHAADGVLSPDEQHAILLTPRPRSVKAMTWSSLDLALLDEAAALIERPAKLGHVVIDEAQDLSPMHLRALARRVVGSCTVLGDLAQATSPSAVENWSAVLTHLERPDGQIEELTHGYRVPAQVIDFAARLLPHIAPELQGPASLRHSPGALRITRTTTGEAIAATITACATALGGEGSVGLIAADADIAQLGRALSASGLGHTLLGSDGTDLRAQRLTLTPVSLAKGLEFDTVIVAEPARIADAEHRGLQRLYVALTRAVSALHIVHATPLPEPLAHEPAMVS